MKQGSVEKGTWKVLTLLDAVTATTESDAVVIAGAKKVTFFFTRANHAAGSSLFDVDVSLDGVTYVDYAKLITNVANTNVQDLIRAASVSLAANGTSMASMDLQHDTVYSIKAKVTETTDGTHTIKVLIEY